MQVGVWLGVTVGGALGAVSRYGVGVWLARAGSGWPWGTLAVNALGCLAIGVVMGLTLPYSEGGAEGGAARWAAPAAVRAAVLAGFLGSFTTFSTFGFETFDLAARGQWRLAGGYVAASVGLGLLAVWAGWRLSGR